MSTTEQGWTVLDESAGILTNSYTFDDSGGRANTLIARVKDGKLLVISPPRGVTDAMFDELAKYGEVAGVVANNGFHHLGQKLWRDRFPKARFFAQPEAAARIGAKNPDVSAGDFEGTQGIADLLPEGAGVRSANGPDSKCGETWAWFPVEGGHIWYASDLLANYDTVPGKGLIKIGFKLTKSAPGYKVFTLAMLAILKNRKAVLRAMLADVKAHPPTTMICGHGAPVVQDGLAEATARMIEAKL